MKLFNKNPAPENVQANDKTVTVIKSGSDYGFTDVYVSLFEAGGWDVRVGSLEDINFPADLVIINFEDAGGVKRDIENMPAEKVVIDFHYDRKYESAFHEYPFYLIDNTTVIVHGLEAVRLFKKVVRPVKTRVVMLAYEGEWKSSQITHGAEGKIFIPARFSGHSWVESMDANFIGDSFPVEVPSGSFLVIPEYDPQVWPAIRWAVATGLPVIAPGLESFKKTIFYGSLLFDPESEDDFKSKISMLLRKAPQKAEKEKLKFGVVVPRYEKQSGGGAENHAGALAKSLITAGHNAEIITTQTDSMNDWNNNLPCGLSNDDDLPVRRFPLKNLDPTKHHMIGHKINMDRELSWSEETEWMRNSVRSQAMELYLAENSNDYDFLFFIPYLYGTTFWGSQVAPEKSFLVPCYHDEPLAYLGLLNQNAQWMAGIFFNTVAEKRLAERAMKIKNPGMFVIGEGVEVNAKGDAERFRNKYKIDGDFILYVGRLQREKNIPDLLDNFESFRANSDSDVKLVLAGRGDMPLSRTPVPGATYLGFLSEEDKIDAFSACSAFVLPSDRESFSIVMMEAWLQGRPVLASSACNVAREHIFKCGGGFLYEGDDEFLKAVEAVTSDRARSSVMGERGRQYVLDNFKWEKIVDNLINTLRKTEIKPLWERLGDGPKTDRRFVIAKESFNSWLSSIGSDGETSPLESGSTLPEFIDNLEDRAEVRAKYREFSHRSVIGPIFSRIRGSLTRHLRKNYIEVIESRQGGYNRDIVRLLKKIYEELRK
ncbi:hypothetical protein MNBD_NITROSPINAE01-1763 [hydrothermal vent metagenome]|uniref:Glycosyl transferase family 1 domain-containing protein n=1 Tax=hydrothermal vent metagenome TaxID=652676 RepID=A0A3B1C834_9ZZZZ